MPRKAKPATRSKKGNKQENDAKTMLNTSKPVLRAKRPVEKENIGNAQRSASQLLRIAPTEVIVKVNQKQSLHIIQTSIAASLSAIMWIRDIFPDDYYEHRNYDLKSPEFAYAIVPMDNVSLKTQHNDQSTVTWDMLVPGKHEHVDKMLYWLKGIGEAVRLKYLSTLVISLHHGYIAPSTLAEAYVLKFSYEGSDQHPRVGLTLGNETVDITLQNQRDITSLFARLVRLAGTHKLDMPEHPAIGMQLTYNETCPDEYEPPGFRAAPPSKWIDETGTIKVGNMDTGYHKLQMSMIPPTQAAPKTPRKPAMTLSLDESSANSPITDINTITPARVSRTLVHRMVAPPKVSTDTQLPYGNTAFTPSIGGAPAVNASVTKKRVVEGSQNRINELSLDEDEEDDDQSSFRRVAFSSSMQVTPSGSSSVVGLLHTARKRKGEALPREDTATSKAKKSFTNSPFAI